MNIRRFVAADMRSALQMVRAAHGPDAVILSNRRTDEGVEIVAASNYDESVVQRALDEAQRREAPTAPPPTEPPQPQAAQTRNDSPAERWLRALAPSEAAASPQAVPSTPPAAPPSAPIAEALQAEVADAGAGFPSFAELLGRRRVPATRVDAEDDGIPSQPPVMPTAPSPEAAVPLAHTAMPSTPPPALVAVPAPPAPASDGELAQMREELVQMRQMIEREMARLTDERLRGSPARGQVMELMDDYGFDAGITRDIALQVPADTPAHRVRGLMLALLSKRLPICPIDPLEEAGVIALVGPTGAGKTTTIAKLAARYVARHQARDVALVTTDTVRVGGREQLHSYGRQLGIAVHEADSETGLVQLLQRLRDYRLVLVDTAGLSQRDRALAGQLHWLRAARQIRTLLVLPANTHFADLDEVVRRFEGARPQGAVLTKLDETGRLGSVLSVAVDHALPLTWIADGQRIPDDLHRANAAHLALRLEDLRRDADKPIVPTHDLHDPDAQKPHHAVA
ncbi:flagellar biosynthesis protein FlhF [Luteimonas sp. TWI662]|uniref:flagellar biosynthesis protein FlhF n=1 Tax=Luteimonas sp. TWI662 TaxID=3136789 RepID=UPI003209D00C